MKEHIITNKKEKRYSILVYNKEWTIHANKDKKKAKVKMLVKMQLDNMKRKLQNK